MKLKSNVGYYLTQVADVPVEERVFKTTIYLMNSEEALLYKEVDEVEKQKIINEGTAIDIDLLSPEYLDSVTALNAAIPAEINKKNFSAADALKYKDYYPVWGDENAPMGKEVDKGFRLRHRASDEEEYTLYEVIQKHTLAAEWVPGIGTESLYIVVTEHEGTLEDPIPWQLNMALELDKYYTENDITYKCIRSSEGKGLSFTLADLVNAYYVEEVKNEEETPEGDGTADSPITYVYNKTVLENGKYYIQDGVKYLCTRDAGMPLAFNLSDLVSAGYVEVA